MSGLTLSGGCGCKSAGLSLNIKLTGGCCKPRAGGPILSPVVPIVRDLIRITSADFSTATDWAGSNTENVTVLPAYSLKLFYNEGNRYLDEGTEWSRTSTGFHILMAGFDSTANNYTIYIHINGN